MQPVSSGRRLEWPAYAAMLSISSLAYFYSGFLAREVSFGFSQLSHLGSWQLGALASVAPLLVLFMPGAPWRRLSALLKRWSVQSGELLSTAPGALLAAAAFLAVFLLLRNGFINGDGAGFITTYSQSGNCMGYDEMWTSYLTFRLWRIVDAHTRMTVRDLYGLWSSLFGAASILVMLRASPAFAGRRWMAFVTLLLCGGFTQLYFGDVEHYTAVNLLVLGYLFSSALYLEEKWTIFVPVTLLSLAVSFHLLAAWLAPSGLYLVWIAIRRKQWRDIAESMFLGAFILAATIIYMHCSGLYLCRLDNSHAAEAGRSLFRFDQPPAYWGQMANLLFLLFPSWGILGLLLLFRRIPFDRTNIFLSLATGSLLLLALSWHAGLWPYNDWNLYAAVGIPAGMLCWRNLLNAPDLRNRGRIALSVMLSAGLHSACWIVGNHFFVGDTSV